MLKLMVDRCRRPGVAEGMTDGHGVIPGQRVSQDSGHAFDRAEADLLAYDDAFDRRYLVERLSGIGIVRP